jgi:hypothetical protein
MDFFGISKSVKDCVLDFFLCMRRTGRTTKLVESVRNGDRIGFIKWQEAHRVRQLCLDRGITIECLVVDPKDPERIFDHPKSEGRTIFDHSLVEEMYYDSIERTKRMIDFFERESSMKRTDF